MDTMKEAIPYQPELDPIDWRTSVRRARNAVAWHIPLILLSCVFSLALLFAYVKIFPPTFKAEVVLQAEPDTDANRNQYYSFWNLFRKQDLKSEPELMLSGRVTRRVVEELGLKFTDVHHTMLTHIGYLWSDSWVGKNYRKFKEWLWPPEPGAYRPTPEEIELARTVDAFREGISFQPVAGTTVGRIVVLAPSYRAGEIANKLVDTFLAERLAIFRTEADKAFKTLDQEVQRAAGDLASIDKEKFEFDTKNKVVLDFEKDKLLVADWVKLRSSVAEVEGVIAGVRASLAIVGAQLATEPAEIVQAKTLQDSKMRSMLQAREFDLKNSLQLMRERYRPDSPDILEMERSLAEVRSALAKEPDKVEVAVERVRNPAHSELRQREMTLQAQLAAATASLESKRRPLAELEQRMNMFPSMSRSVLEQARVREGLEARYKMLRDRAMMADVSRAAVASAPSSIRVIDYATPPMRAAWPKMLILVPSALALGLFLGFGMALMAEIFSTRVNRDRLSSRPEFPVYAVIHLRPELGPRARRSLTEAIAAPQSAIARLRGPA
jgi:uncharacterized protein involved in exopolysaccharide biosynthesis